MISAQIMYSNVDSVKNALGNSHYLLESIVGDEIPVGTLRTLLVEYQNSVRDRIKRKRIEDLRTHIVTEVLEFSGMGRGNSEWWTALIRLDSTIKQKKPVFFLLVGWHNRRQTDASVVSSGGEEKLEGLWSNYAFRIERKIEDGYEPDVCYKNVKIRRTTELPPLPGLGKPPKISWKQTLGEDDWAEQPRPTPPTVYPTSLPRVVTKHSPISSVTGKPIGRFPMPGEEIPGVDPSLFRRGFQFTMEEEPQESSGMSGLMEGAEELANKLSEGKVDPSHIEGEHLPSTPAILPEFDAKLVQNEKQTQRMSKEKRRRVLKKDLEERKRDSEW